MRYKVLIIVLLFITFFRIGQSIYSQKEKFFSRGWSGRFQEYQKAYFSSQYIQKKNPGIIPDESLEIFAAESFLRGLNPILIVHDHPPLGRYIVALSLIIFDNPHVIMIPLILLSLLGLFLVGYEILPNAAIALIPVLFFANEPLLLDKFVSTPLLEPIQFPFLVFALYFFILGVTKKNCLLYFIATAIMLGFVISIRFFATGAALLFCMLTYFLLQRKLSKSLFLFLATLPLSLVILLLSYTRTMMDGYSVIKIFGIQKYILVYHKSKFILPFTYWDLLLFNRWHTWWGTWAISSDAHWIITWPLGMIFSISNFLYGIFKKISFQPGETVMMLWIFVYSAMLSTGYTSTNYFLPIIPFTYIIATAFFVKIVKKYQVINNKKKIIV